MAVIAAALALALTLASPGATAAGASPEGSGRARRGLLPRKAAKPSPASRGRRLVAPQGPTWLGEPGAVAEPELADERGGEVVGTAPVAPPAQAKPALAAGAEDVAAVAGAVAPAVTPIAAEIPTPGPQAGPAALVTAAEIAEALALASVAIPLPEIGRPSPSIEATPVQAPSPTQAAVPAAVAVPEVAARPAQAVGYQPAQARFGAVALRANVADVAIELYVRRKVGARDGAERAGPAVVPVRAVLTGADVETVVGRQGR